MTKLNIDIEKIIKEAFMQNFDTTAFINKLSEDICEDNPHWWVEQIVEPMRETLNKAILENEKLLKECIFEYLDEEFDIRTEEYIRDAAERRIESLTRGLRIRLEKGDDTKNI